MTEEALELAAKKKAARIKRANEVKDLAKELFKIRYEDLLVSMSTKGAEESGVTSREAFLARMDSYSERSIEDAAMFTAAWKRKKGLYLTEPEK